MAYYTLKTVALYNVNVLVNKTMKGQNQVIDKMDLMVIGKKGIEKIKRVWR